MRTASSRKSGFLTGFLSTTAALAVFARSILACSLSSPARVEYLDNEPDTPRGFQHDKRIIRYLGFVAVALDTGKAFPPLPDGFIQTITVMDTEEAPFRTISRNRPHPGQASSGSGILY